MFYTYILKSLKDNSYYIGYTQNLSNRLKQHNAGKNRYTKGHIPYRIIHQENFGNIKEAKLKEKKIKSIGAYRYLEILGSPEAKLQD